MASLQRVFAGWLASIFTAFAVSALASAAAAGAPREVRFAPGRSAATIEGEVKGGQGLDYRLVARAGQTLTVQMTVLAHAGLSFNLAPEGASEAMVIGEHTGLKARVLLPADGAYVISTFLPRSAARRNETGRFRLVLALDGTPLAPLPGATDARVAGTRYHATAAIRCRWAYAPAAGRCDTGVVRRGNDATATVDIRGADGQRRRLLFVKGRLAASDSAWPASTRRSGDITTVEFDGQERHEVTDAMLTGG